MVVVVDLVMLLTLHCDLVGPALVLVTGIAQTYLVWKYKTKWMLAMTIGCYSTSLERWASVLILINA